MSQPQANQPDHEQAESLRVLLEQHLLHCRHIESERAWFMNVYAVIAGIILTNYFQDNVRELWLLSFLIVFTLIGFLLTWRWKLAFQCHQREAEETAKALGVSLNLTIPANRFWKICGTTWLFLYFYAIIFTGIIILFIKH